MSYCSRWPRALVCPRWLSSWKSVSQPSQPPRSPGLLPAGPATPLTPRVRLAPSDALPVRSPSLLVRPRSLWLAPNGSPLSLALPDVVLVQCLRIPIPSSAVQLRVLAHFAITTMVVPESLGVYNP